MSGALPIGVAAPDSDPIILTKKYGKELCRRQARTGTVIFPLLKVRDEQTPADVP
jgi:hypothetical protein